MEQCLWVPAATYIWLTLSSPISNISQRHFSQYICNKVLILPYAPDLTPPLPSLLLPDLLHLYRLDI